MSRSMLRTWISIALLAVFLTWVAWYVSANPKAFSPLAEVSLLDGFLLLLAFVVIMAFNGAFIALISRVFRIRLITSEWLCLSFASSFANYFLPFKGGVGLRALYLSHVHGLPISKFVSTLSVAYLMHSVVNGLMALIGLAINVIHGGPVNAGLLMFFAVVTLAGIVVILIDIDIGEQHERFPMAQVASMLTAWQAVRGNRVIVFQLWLLMLGLALATIWQCRVAFDAVSVELPWSGIMVYAASKNLATLISLTPGSLGVVELISIYLGGVLDYSTANALSVQALIRAIAIVTLLLAGPFAVLFLRRRLKPAGQPNPETNDA